MQLLERLARENFPIEQTGDEMGWFRYHPLFQRLLRHQLAVRHALSELAELHGRAGAWLAKHDLVADALHHLLAASDTISAASLVEEQAHPALQPRGVGRHSAGWLRLAAPGR